MIKYIILLFCSLSLTSCNGWLKKTTSIIELTSKLESQSSEPVVIHSDINFALPKNFSSNKLNNSIISSPLIENGIVYTVSNKAILSAFSTKTNKVLWSHNIADKSKDNVYLGGGLVFNNNKLIVTYGSRFLVVVNASDGNELFRKEFPDIIQVKPVLLSPNVVVIQTVSNQLIAYNMPLAKIVWGHESTLETLSSNLDIHPIHHENGLIAFYSNGQIVYLTSKLGQEIWSLNLSTNYNNISLPGFETVSIQCQPKIDGKFIYIASSTGQLIKLDLHTGQVAWTIKAEDVQSMAINGNNLFITNNARQVASVSLVDGKIKWVANLKKSKDTAASKASTAFAAFVTNNNDLSLNVATSEGLLYSYLYADNKLSATPVVTLLIKNLKYLLLQNQDIYFVNDTRLFQVNKK